jgi:ribosomal protein L40E
MTPDTTNLTYSDIMPFLTAALAVFIILFVSTIVVALFYRRSLSSFRDKSGIGLFGTAGTVLLLGAVLTIILIGYVIVWFDLLLLAIAFLQLRPPSIQPAQTTQTTVSLVAIPSEVEKTSASISRVEGKKYCMNCGAELSSEAGFCPRCGMKQEQ